MVAAGLCETESVYVQADWHGHLFLRPEDRPHSTARAPAGRSQVRAGRAAGAA